MNVIRIAVQGRAVVNVAQGIKDVRIDAILNTVNRSIGEDGVDAGRMGGAELIRCRPNRFHSKYLRLCQCEDWKLTCRKEFWLLTHRLKAIDI
jgi:hypothetical protein